MPVLDWAPTDFAVAPLGRMTPGLAYTLAEAANMQTDLVVTLSDGKLAQAEILTKCDACPQWLGDRTGGHGTIEGGPCRGKPNPRHTKLAVYVMKRANHWRYATAAEKWEALRLVFARAGDPRLPRFALARIAEIIETVDHRAMAADGPVTPTRQEMTDDEMREIYALAKGVK